MVADRALRKYLHPTLDDFSISKFSGKFDGREVIHKLLEYIPDASIMNSMDEYKLLLAELRDRLTNSDYGMDIESAKFLYLLVRLTKPESVVETGVANGISTFFILNAMKSNRFGKLTSIDISYDVTTFLNDEEKMRWELRVLNIKKNPRRQFKDIMAGIEDLSIYQHDGDHSYLWQQMEYNLAFNKLKPGGFLLSGDVDSSFAFIDSFGNENSEIQFKGILVGDNKVFGYIEKKS